MSISRGVITEITSSAARAISVSSTLPIALVLTSNVQAGVYGFDSPKDAMESELFKDHTDGNLMKYLDVGANKFNVIVPTIISIANIGEDDDETKTNIINATNLLSSVAGKLNLASSDEGAIGFKPDILGVADYAMDDADVRDALISACDSSKGRTFIDLNCETNGDAIAERDLIGSERVTVTKCNLGSWNTETSKIDIYDSGIVICWLRVFIDGSSKIGYSQSVSNRVLPFSSVAYPSEFYPGGIDETDPLTEKQIMSFITYKGLRSWEYSTCSADPMWQDARRVRILDLASEAVIDGIFYVVDKDLSALTSAKKTLKAFMASLVGDKVMLGFSVYLDTERTTPERIDAGEFYFIVENQETPSPKLICVTFDRVNRFAPIVYKIIEEA